VERIHQTHWQSNAILGMGKKGQPRLGRPSLRATAVVFNVRALGQLWRCAPQRARVPQSQPFGAALRCAT
jgi:hypothetical protein